MLNLIYTYSIKLSGSSIDKYIKLLKRAYLHNSQYHSIILYTDEETLPYVQGIFPDIRLVEIENLQFMDDIKMEIIDKLHRRDILTDYDIFLNSPITLPEKFNVYVDRRGKVKELVLYNHLFEHLRHEGYDLYTKDITTYLNVGFLKINGKHRIRVVKDAYYALRNWYVDNKIEERTQFTYHTGVCPSIAALQYNLERISKISNWKVCEMKRYNSYHHLVGEDKFKEINTKNTII